MSIHKIKYRMNTLFQTQAVPIQIGFSWLDNIASINVDFQLPGDRRRHGPPPEEGDVGSPRDSDVEPHEGRRDDGNVEVPEGVRLDSLDVRLASGLHRHGGPTGPRRVDERRVVGVVMRSLVVSSAAVYVLAVVLVWRRRGSYLVYQGWTTRK